MNLSFDAICLIFGAIYLNFGVVCLKSGAKIWKQSLFEGCGGGWVGSPGAPEGFVVSVSENNIPPTPWSIGLVCCGNIWKETYNWVVPDKIRVGNSWSVSRINPQTQSSNLRAWLCFEYQTSYWFDWDREILSHDCWDKFKLDWRTDTTLSLVSTN